MERIIALLKNEKYEYVSSPHIHTECIRYIAAFQVQSRYVLKAFISA